MKLNVKRVLGHSGLAVCLLALGACATTATTTESAQAPVESAVRSVASQADREAILAMAGNYKVTFHFEEVVSFQDGYELKKPKDSGGDEVVYVLQDDPGFISLQHILVVGKDEKFPVKHWRQDWIYEPAYIFEFVGYNAWRKRELSEEERRGKWAQVVYQVDDSPRYAALGTWDHKHGISEWAGRNWRPLPRRDMTKRDDYDALDIQNRHVITFDGWVHEQDNTKLVLSGDAPVALAREIGVNTYRKFDDFAVNVADDYWAETKKYWAGVRDIWTSMEQENDAFGLTLQGEPVGLYTALMDLADDIIGDYTTADDAIAEAKKVIAEYTTTDIDASIAEARLNPRSLDKDGS